MFFFFFFQAEDGIRDWSVTGVQTCALPIFQVVTGVDFLEEMGVPEAMWHFRAKDFMAVVTMDSHGNRSEERRVGKSVDLGGRRIIKKKKEQREKISKRASIATRHTVYCD